MSRKSKKLQLKQRLNEYQLKRRYYDKYKHLKSIGYTDDQTTKMIRKDASMTSLAKLEYRITFAQNQYGTTGVDLGGIKTTEEVKDYISKLQAQDVILPYRKGNDALRLAHPKMWDQ